MVLLTLGQDHRPPDRALGKEVDGLLHLSRRENSYASRALKTALAVALGATLLAAGAAAQDTIKIGVTQPLTGAFAASGNYVAQGAKIAEEEINKAGGVLGKKIELIVEDNKSNPTEAVATAEKLIVKDKVPVMLGAWSSTLTLAVMPKLEEYKVPMVVETSSSGKITTSGNPYIFRISPTSEMEAKAFTPLVKTIGIKKVGLPRHQQRLRPRRLQGVLRDGEEGRRDGRRHGDHGSRRPPTSRRSSPRSRPRAATRCS